MLLALVLAAAPVSIELTGATLSVDGRALAVSFDDVFLDLPPLHQALRARATDAGLLDARIDVAADVPFSSLMRVLFTAVSAGARDPEVRLVGAPSFRQAMGRSAGSLRLTREGLLVGGATAPSDGGVPDADALKKALGAASGEVVTVSVHQAVTAAALAPVVAACIRAGYRVALTPTEVAAPRPGNALSTLAPPATADTPASAPIVMGSLDKNLIRKVILANRGQVRACYEALLVKKPAAEGKVAVKFVISPKGSVASAELASDSIGDEGLATCLTKAVTTWVFQAPLGGGIVIVTYPFLFKAGPP